MQRKDTRPLTVNGKLWEYKIGRNTIAIYDPEGKKYFPKFTDFYTEQAIASKQSYFNPATILNFILTKILLEEPKHHKCKCCNRVKSDVRLRCNPFAAEINEDYTKHYFCDECVSDLADEI